MFQMHEKRIPEYDTIHHIPRHFHNQAASVFPSDIRTLLCDLSELALSTRLHSGLLYDWQDTEFLGNLIKIQSNGDTLQQKLFIDLWHERM